MRPVAALKLRLKRSSRNRQKEILEKLRVNDHGKSSVAFEKIESNQLDINGTEIICGLINSEFMMEGVLPNFESNEYGIELENLLNVINRPRIKPN